MKFVCLTLLSAAAFAGAAAAEADPCIDFGPTQCKENAACRWSENERNVELGRKDAVHKGGEWHGQGCHMVHAYYRDPKHGHEEIVKAVEALGMGTDLDTMACSEAFGLKDCKDINQAGGKTKCSWACDPDTYAGSCVDQTADNKNLQKCSPPGEYTGDCSECTHGIRTKKIEPTTGVLEASMVVNYEEPGLTTAWLDCTYFPPGEDVTGFDYADYDGDGLGYVAGNTDSSNYEKSPGACYQRFGSSVLNKYRLCLIGNTGDLPTDSNVCGRHESTFPAYLYPA